MYYRYTHRLTEDVSDPHCPSSSTNLISLVRSVPSIKGHLVKCRFQLKPKTLVSPIIPLSQTPGRPTVNPAGPIPEAHPEVGLHSPSSRIIQKSPPTVLRPCPSRPFPTPPSAGCVKYLGRVRPTSAGTLPGASLPASALRPAPRLPAALSRVFCPHKHRRPTRLRRLRWLRAVSD